MHLHRTRMIFRVEVVLYVSVKAVREKKSRQLVLPSEGWSRREMKLCRWRSALKLSGCFSSLDVSALWQLCLLCVTLSRFLCKIFSSTPVKFYTFSKSFDSPNWSSVGLSSGLSNSYFSQ